MNFDIIKDFFEFITGPVRHALPAALLAWVVALAPGSLFALTQESKETGEAAASEETKKEQTKHQGGKVTGRKKIDTAEFISGTLPPRKTSAGAFLALGYVGASGFLLGSDFFFGWRLIKFMSLHLRGGAGYVQKRSGFHSTMVHADVTFPVRLAICSHTPRVCPGLDFYFSIIPGAGYGLLMQNKPFKLMNHAVNAIMGVSLESIRTYGNMDAGVRFGAYIYIDFLKDNEEEDPWLAYAIFELGAVIRWGKTK